MRGIVIVIALAAASMGVSGAAGTEDFTGFYAGVNAGYAFGRDERRSGPSSGAAEPGRGGPSLPPSALEAARAMKETSKVGGTSIRSLLR